MCSLHLTHPSAHTPGAVLGVRCLAQGSRLSRGQFLLEPRFEPTTSSYKSDALSTRATTACVRERIERVAESEFVLSFSPFLFLFCSNVLRS